MEELKVLFKLDECDMRILNQCDDIIGKCKRVIVDDEQYVDANELIGCIENLVYEVEHREDEIRDLKQDVEDNYKHISYAEQIGYNIHDFV